MHQEQYPTNQGYRRRDEDADLKQTSDELLDGVIADAARLVDHSDPVKPL
jgi:hypothetical protein